MDVQTDDDMHRKQNDADLVMVSQFSIKTKVHEYIALCFGGASLKCI